MDQADMGRRNAQIIRQYEAGKSAREIGAEFGYTPHNIYRILHQYGKPVRKGYPIDLQEITNDIRYYRDIGISVYGIIEKLKIHPRHKQLNDIKAYIKTFPLFGNDDYQQCPKCGLIADKDLFSEKNRKTVLCKACKKEYLHNLLDSKGEQYKAERLEKLKAWHRAHNQTRKANGKA